MAAEESTQRGDTERGEQMSIDATRVRPNLVLAICCSSLLLVSMDVTIVNVALPAIRRDLQASTSGLQWIVDSYIMVVASLLMLSGSLADRFGRRRTFQVGMALFTLASALCSAATSVEGLVAFRMLQGVGASMLNPVAMSIIVNTFLDPAARAKAIGVWGAVFGVSIALGPLVGGLLTQSVGWRSIFWINLPIGVCAIVLAHRFVPESKAPRPRAVDPFGQFLVFAAIASITFAFIEGRHRGWTSLPIAGALALGAGAVLALLVYEPRQREPLIDVRLFRSPPFAAANLIALCMFSAFGGILFLSALYLQEVRGMPPFRTGLYTMPLAVMTVVCSPISGRLVARYGPRPSLLVAGGALAAGAALLTTLHPTTSLTTLLIAYSMFGIAFGLGNMPVTNAGVSGMPRERAGLAAAVISTSRQVASALGVAISGALVGSSELARDAGRQFCQATHPFWWGVVLAGFVVAALGVLLTSRWARASAQRLSDEDQAGAWREPAQALPKPF